MRLLAWIKRLFRGVNIDNNNSLINKSKIMAKKTVITKVLDANAQDGIIEFPQNRTLYADQFTDVAPNTDEDREGFKAKSMKEVFEHYQPSKEGVALETEEGGAVYENFEFKQIKDFEDEQIDVLIIMLITEYKKRYRVDCSIWQEFALNAGRSDIL